MSRIIPESELILNADGSMYHLNLRPEDLGEVIFTVGDPDRVPKVSMFFDRIELKKQSREFVTHTGFVGKTRVTVMSTGMGTDNIEILMMELDALTNLDLESRTVKSQHISLKIVRLGTSGTVHEEIEVGSFLVSETAIGLDTLMQFYPSLSTDQGMAIELKKSLKLNFQPYQANSSSYLINKIPAHFLRGITLTAPGFYAPQGRELRIKPIINNYISLLQSFNYQGRKITNFEMETAGYYALGELLGHEVLSLNAIIANRVTGEFDKKAEKTVNHLINTALESLL